MSNPFEANKVGDDAGLRNLVERLKELENKQSSAATALATVRGLTDQSTVRGQISEDRQRLDSIGSSWMALVSQGHYDRIAFFRRRPKSGAVSSQPTHFPPTNPTSNPRYAWTSQFELIPGQAGPRYEENEQVDISIAHRVDSGWDYSEVKEYIPPFWLGNGDKFEMVGYEVDYAGIYAIA